jgi:nucleotide-binding universal stress UspA family protein
MVRKILLCTDGSECALRAARYTAELAQPLKAEVVLLSIFNPPVGATLWTQEPLPTKRDDLLRTGETVEEALTKASKSILTQAGISFSTHVEVGDPVPLILDFAKAKNADLIVVGSRGQSGFSSLLLGSVSDSIAHHAPCPVLIVR